jgi:hypothetical protein
MTARVSRGARWVFPVLAALFIASILVQVTLAGISIFIDGNRWSVHEAFGHFLTPMILLMLIVALIGRLPRRITGLVILTFVLLLLQGALGAIGGWAGAFHPANALVIFGLSLRIAVHSRRAA